jgi:hypothetical protein
VCIHMYMYMYIYIYIQADLHKMNANAILYHLKSFAGPFGGPRSESVGYDDLTQVSP